MRVIQGAICAASLVLLCLAGCESSQLTGFFALESHANGRDRVVAASVDSVAQSAQATLSNLGMEATVTRQGEAVRVASKTSKGALFTLVLTREMVNGLEHTRARIEWADGREDPVGGQLLAALDMVSKR